MQAEHIELQERDTHDGSLCHISLALADTNVTGVAFNEPDTWRKEGIRFILDHALAYKR